MQQTFKLHKAMLTHFTWHKFSSRNVLFIQQNYLQTRIFTAVNRACLRTFAPNIRDIDVNAMLIRESYADVINCEVRYCQSEILRPIAERLFIF